MSKHKKQHYIPRCYLKPWCDPSTPQHKTPYVWVFSKDGSEARKKAPENIFYETEMYTIEGTAGSRNLVLENGLTQLEQGFATIRTHRLNSHQPLDAMQHLTVCAFIAAMEGRTKANREFVRQQWDRPLKVMEHLMEWAKTATPEQKRSSALLSSRSSSRYSFSYADVKALVETPLQKMLIPFITASTPLLCKLDFAILYTMDTIGFITSDDPCVWFDSKAYKRPPLYRSPALMYETIEITLPISPRQCFFLNRKGLKGYVFIDSFVDSLLVDEINRRTRFSANEFFVVKKNQKRESWFDPGVEPEDSWEKMQAKKDEKEKNEKSLEP
jgi:hypothetical protein